MAAPSTRSPRACARSSRAGARARSSRSRPTRCAMPCVDAAIDAVVVNDLAGRIVEWNPAAADTLRDRARRRPGPDLRAADHPRAPARRLPRGLRAQRRQRLHRSPRPLDRVRRTARRRQRVPGRGRDHPDRCRRRPSSSATCATSPPGVERDAKLAEARRSLEEAERRYRTLLENLPSITYRAGLGYAGGWEYISPQVEEVLGYTPGGVDVRPGLLGARDAPR